GASLLDEISSSSAFKDWSFVSILRDSKRKLSMAGYQRNRLFLNMGDMQFVDVGYMEGVDSIYDGYIVATADYNSDGKMDLILKNGDPGSTKYMFPSIQIFKNEFGMNHGLTLSL